jgi:hypothetical protein
LKRKEREVWYQKVRIFPKKEDESQGGKGRLIEPNSSLIEKVEFLSLGERLLIFVLYFKNLRYVTLDYTLTVMPLDLGSQLYSLVSIHSLNASVDIMA